MRNKTIKLLTVLAIVVLLLPVTLLAKNDRSVNEAEVHRFYDALMELVSYDKYRDFYDNYIEEMDITYDNFVKEVKGRGIGISGGYASRLAGWQRKGKKVIVTIDSSLNGKDKRVQVALEEKKDGLKISSKEFINKICENKRGTRKKK